MNRRLAVVVAFVLLVALFALPSSIGAEDESDYRRADRIQLAYSM